MQAPRSLHPFVMLTLLVALCGCGDGTRPAHEEDESDATPIVGGASADDYPEAVLIDMEVEGELVAACSGALIAPRVVLTAGHCVYGYDGWQITAPALLAHRRAAGSALYDWDVDGELVAPDRHEIGLLFLKKGLALPSYPTIADRPLRAGQRVRNIGRVLDGQLTEHLFVGPPVEVEDGEPYGYPLSYVAKPRIEQGDSGGPAVVAKEAAHIIAAVNSGGGGVELLARVDLVRDWISGQIGGPPSSCAHDPCTVGARLAATCGACAPIVCDADPFCCATEWDAQCADEASVACACE